MEAVLNKFGEPDQDEVQSWVALVDRLRPPRPGDTERAIANLRELTRALRERDDLKQRLRNAIIRLFHDRKVVSLYVSSGLLPSSGFFSETSRRVSGRLLPEVTDTEYMRGLLGVVFNRVSDEIWVNDIPDEDWIAFINS